MAEAIPALWCQDHFNCPICLDLLKDPVTIPCGHNYCMSCITDCWNQDDPKRVYSCPQCRHTFTPRPALNKNVMFAEIVEKLKSRSFQTVHPGSRYAEPGDVECDVCTGRKHKAVKSCLVCLNSYCELHLEQHDSFFKDKRHNLINATGRLREMICSQHGRLLEVYCRTDQKCICLMCTMNEHTKHNTVSAEAERSQKQKPLGDMQRKLEQIIEEKERDLELLKEAVINHKISAQMAVEHTETIFTEINRSIEKRRSEMIRMIRIQEKTEVSRAEGHLMRLEQDIVDLKRRNAELKQLLQTDDHIQFLQTFQALCVPPACTNISFSSLITYEDVGKSVSVLRRKVEDICKEEITKISDRVTYSIATAELRTRDQFLQYSCQLTMDSNTAHRYLNLAEGNQVATCVGADQQYPDHPDRFSDFSQFLCMEDVFGRCYWEIDWSGEDGVGISVSYKNISRKGQGNDCVFGYNDQSWRLSLSYSRCTFRHNQKEIQLPVVSSSSRIGVFVDHKAGILSFFRVSNQMSLIHSIKTTFTAPLYPGFGINLGSTLKLYGLQ